jgi:endogenous inhibitor of DNA gyrase (YacG/DUF329 family)
MHCPICNATFNLDQSEAPPFCSERCRTIDLGRWLDQRYGMPAMPDPEDDELPEPASD